MREKERERKRERETRTIIIVHGGFTFSLAPLVRLTHSLTLLYSYPSARDPRARLASTATLMSDREVSASSSFPRVRAVPTPRGFRASRSVTRADSTAARGARA